MAFLDHKMNEFSLNNVLKYKKYKYIKTLQSIVEKNIPSKKVEKFFPSINLDGHLKIDKEINVIRLKTIYDLLNERVYDERRYGRMSKSEYDEFLLAEIVSQRTKLSNNRITLKEDIDIFGKKIFAKNQDITKFVLEKFGGNIRPKYVVFSSKPEDIMHMSMRGIESCMRWSSNQSISLIGSVIDPYCSIIYLTDNLKTKNMLARAVVRYVHNDDKNRNEIFIEKIYFNKDKLISSDILSNYIIDEDFDLNEIQTIFEKYIESKTNLNVLSSYEYCSDDISMINHPLNDVSVDHGCESYSDADLVFSDDDYLE